MDLVSALAARLDLDGNLSGSLAGALLALVTDTVRDRHGAAAAERLDAVAPELRVFQASAPTLVPGLFKLNSAPLVLEGEHDEFHDVLERFGVDVSSAGPVASLLLQFLSTRLDDEALEQVIGAVPALGEVG